MSAVIRVFLASILAALAYSASAQQAYPTPGAAAAALVTALGTKEGDAKRLATLLGDDWNTYIPVGSVDRQDVDAFLALYREKRTIQTDASGRAHLVVGNTPWTFPLPIIQDKDGWRFDAKAGSEEIRVRRIGRNEIGSMQALLAYHDAQMDYADIDRDGDGVLEYAQKIISTDGQYDGLYWDEKPGIEESPLGPLFGDTERGDDWQGYHYRILTAQGPSAPGGAYDYKIGENMTRGFAMIAWPAKYGDSGVMSFMISHDGQVFEKDLGPDGEKLAKALPRFDPDSSWDETKVPGAP
ncbi:DUF2950 domain-containing protein [Pseudomonas boanensis]|uniref:DUF2950 domain-containing protein n=1 Tax=Metapseudomonas boanensis TaxID=2822138 RepID=UPI0035D5259D